MDFINILLVFSSFAFSGLISASQISSSLNDARPKSRVFFSQVDAFTGATSIMSVTTEGYDLQQNRVLGFRANKFTYSLANMKMAYTSSCGLHVEDIFGLSRGQFYRGLKCGELTFNYDGTKLVCLEFGIYDATKIHIIDLERRKRLVFKSVERVVKIRFSLDSSAIIAVIEPIVGLPEMREISIKNPRNAKTIFNFEERFSIALFSPDGAKIITKNAENRIYLIDLIIGSKTEIPRDEHETSPIIWSCDSNRIFFAVDLNTEYQILKIINLADFSFENVMGANGELIKILSLEHCRHCY